MEVVEEVETEGKIMAHEIAHGDGDIDECSSDGCIMNADENNNMTFCDSCINKMRENGNNW